MKLFLRLAAVLYLGLLLSPLIFLFSVPEADIQLDSLLIKDAALNTLGLSLFVLFLSTPLGAGWALAQCYYQHPARSWLHGLTLMPLAFPAYVLAFVYLGVLGPTSPLHFAFFEVQGSLLFLSLILSLAFIPYIYFFTYMGLTWVRQSERETEALLQGGAWRFFRYNLWPKLGFFIVSGQVLVLFETLSDFGAASVINVPVMTTLIYKAWFDLFSFEAAARLALYFSLVVLIVLVVEFFLKRKDFHRSENLDSLRPQRLSPLLAGLLTGTRFFYVFLACILPTLQLCFWVMREGSQEVWKQQMFPLLVSFLLASSAAFCVVGLSLALGFFMRKKHLPTAWFVFSSVGYGIPGTLLAVAFYAILLYFFESLSTNMLLLGLLIAMVYKFLSVGLRPIGDSIISLPQSLDETSDLLGVGSLRRWRHYLWPYLRSTLGLGFCLVAIEVIKEMPLSLMLAPSEYPTLSIQVFNYTMEAEWHKAAAPALIIVLLGFLAVLIMHSEHLGGKK